MMKYLHIAGLEKPISRLVIGTLIYSLPDIHFTCDMLDFFVSLGGDALDAAHFYGEGDSERAIGK